MGCEEECEMENLQESWRHRLMDVRAELDTLLERL
jgi:hypothetical protein